MAGAGPHNTQGVTRMSTQSKKPHTDWAQAFASEIDGDNEPVEVFIVDRNGEPYTDAEGKPACIYALGQYSDAVKAYDKKQRRAVQRAIRSGQRVRDDAEDVLRQTAERLAAATTGWRLAVGGTAVPFSTENAARLYMSAEWIGDQVWAAVRAHADFFTEKSSS
jgi:hypothetical protein